MEFSCRTDPYYRIVYKSKASFTRKLILYKQNILKVLLEAQETETSGFITCEDMTSDITRF